METVGLWVFLIIIIVAFYGLGKIKTDPAEIKRREADRILRLHGPLSPQYICPHCQTKGFVHTMPVKRKKGVSGAKLTGAAFTLGLSMIATGLSRKEGLTQAHCGNCNSTWDF